ncbi:MAG: hypothetical protein F6K39_08710 [Okeania sp. SIO3B3]|nr:hypothetical protein [Okeania sp. SIO3B3]
MYPINSITGVISCPLKYLHLGRRKAEGSYAEGRRERKFEREKVFLSLIIRT